MSERKLIKVATLPIFSYVTEKLSNISKSKQDTEAHDVVSIEKKTESIPVSTGEEQKETTIVTGRFVEDTSQEIAQVPVIIQRIEHHRQVAESFSEDAEDLPDQIVRVCVKTLAYIAPVALAITVSLLVGQDYSDLKAGNVIWAIGMYTTAFAVEFALWYTSFAASRVLKRVFSDKSQGGILAVLIVLFLIVSAGSILAQLYVYEHTLAAHEAATKAATKVASTSLNMSDIGATVGMLFRTCATTVVDILSLAVLATLNYQSFKKHLQKQSDIADHMRQLSQKEVEINRIQSEEIQRQQKAEIENQRALRQAQFFADMEQKQIESWKSGSREERGRW